MPVHKAKVAQNVLDKAKVKKLPWPAYSPDLNPIENLWSVMESKLRTRTPPRNLTHLQQMVRREWKAIPQDFMRDLIASMPRRVKTIIEARGGPTSY